MSPQSNTTVRKVAIVGGSGNVGVPIVASLLARGHDVTVFSRPESTATFPANVTALRGPEADESWLLSGLTGQDVLILAVSAAAMDSQGPWIRSAVRAGVRYILPCEFGADLARPEMAEVNGAVAALKGKYRTMIQEESQSAGGTTSYIAVGTNPWLDFTLRVSKFPFDLKARKARVYGDGTAKVPLSTTRRAGESVAALLSLPEDELTRYKNGWAYTRSFYVSQRDLLSIAARTTGTVLERDWEVVSENADELIAAAAQEMTKGNVFGALAMSLFPATFHPQGWGDFNDKVMDYERMGLTPEEDLDEAMRVIVQES